MLNKTVFAWAILLSLGIRSYGQKATRLGFRLAGLDFYGPQTGQYFFQNTAGIQSITWDPAFGLCLQKEITPHLDLDLSANLSSLQLPLVKNDTSYLKSKRQQAPVKNQQAFVNFDAAVLLSLLDKNTHTFIPQMQTGCGYYMQLAQNGVNIHGGPALTIRCLPKLNVQAAAMYHFSITNSAQSYLQYSIGLLYTVNKTIVPVKRKKKVTLQKIDTSAIVPIKENNAAVPLMQDTDNDGLADSEDNCITEPGRRETFGCPDADRDGVADKQDACPEIKGSKAARGCPDKDGDGVRDDKDECPDVYGNNAGGCPDAEPVPPSAPPIDQPLPEHTTKVAPVEGGDDNARWKNEFEKVKTAASQVQFNSGTAYIHPQSYAALDTLVNVLRNEPLLQVDIEGHTDNVGSENGNLLLSQQRADACKNYLLQKGISADRISAIGYGQMNPIADNQTAEGRKINRRTEFLLVFPKK